MRKARTTARVFSYKTGRQGEEVRMPVALGDSEHVGGRMLGPLTMLAPTLRSFAAAIWSAPR